MAEFTGSFPGVEIAALLWALPLLPLAGALLAARVARLEEEPDAAALWAAPIATWLALLAALPVTYRLVSLEGASRVLVAPGPVLLRLGSLDLHLGLGLDAAGALAVITMLLVASLAQVGLATSRLSLHRLQGTLAAVAAATAAGLLALLASCPLVSGVGSGGLVLLGGVACGTVGPGPRGPGRAALPLVGDALLLLGAAAVSWGLLGAWSSGELVPASRPRFVVVSRGGTPAKQEGTSGPGFLSLTTTPGARVFLDSNSEPFAEAPFARRPVPAGPHTIAIDPGHGMDRIELQKFRIEEGSEVALLRGDSAAEVHGITALLGLREGKDPLVLRGRLAESRWGGLPVSAWVAALLLGGLVLKLIPPRASAAASWLQALRLLVPQVGGLLIAALLAVRWLPALGLGAGWPSWLPALALGGSAVLALAGLTEQQPARALGFGASASVMIGAAAAAAGAPDAAMLQGIVAATAAALGLWVLARVERREASWTLASHQGTAQDEGSVRWLKLSYAGLIGLAPVGFGLLEALPSLGWSRFLLLPLLALVAASLGRTIYTLTEGDGPREESPKNQRREGKDKDLRDRESDPVLEALPARLTPALGLWLVALGPLSISSLFEAPLASWLASTPAVRAAPPPTSALTFGLWLLLSAAGLLGARLARGLHGARRPEDWASEEPSRQPQAALLAAGQGARRLLDALTSASARLGARLSAPFGP